MLEPERSTQTSRFKERITADNHGHMQPLIDNLGQGMQGQQQINSKVQIGSHINRLASLQLTNTLNIG